jgi:hypothetical protein
MQASDESPIFNEASGEASAPASVRETVSRKVVAFPGGRRLRVRSRLGKYRLVRRVGHGGFSDVFEARDTIEGIDVALKVPHAQFHTRTTLDELRHEVRLTATLEHPNILPIKNAQVIEGVFVIAYPLGLETLADRLERRLSARTALSFAEQAIEAVAHAHHHRIIHCDIKPENFILFPGDRLRLADFGIAKVALRRGTLASGQGTIGYVAPEQALGKPSMRSDVFSLGLLVYRMFAGVLPEWPYEWPPPGFDRARQLLHPDVLALLRRCLDVDDRKRFPDAQALLAAFQRVKGRALRQRTRRKPAPKPRAEPEWKDVRMREFTRRFGTVLAARGHCPRCKGAVSEAMQGCPWCGHRMRRYQGPTTFPRRCKRCGRGAKPDWKYCAFCYGGRIQPDAPRSYSDKRYRGRCHNESCRGPLMPFLRYCPWCRVKTRNRPLIAGHKKRCGKCGWGVLGGFWEHCPWCVAALERR